MLFILYMPWHDINMPCISLCLSSKKTPRIKLFSVTPKMPKDTSEDNNTNDESREVDMPRSPTFGTIIKLKFDLDLTFQQRILASPPKIYQIYQHPQRFNLPHPNYPRGQRYVYFTSQICQDYGTNFSAVPCHVLDPKWRRIEFA
jgi:hypothetical protein